ncbi:MAG: ABC transporter ATP-binding protein [Acidobacteriota bacterium]
MQKTEKYAAEVRGLVRSYGRHEAVRGLDMIVERGQCHGFFGRNGAGKTTTIKCLLNHLQPESGSVRVFGMDPRVDEVAVKLCIGYVPDDVAFYPWMTVRQMLDYSASFRPHWNRELERELLDVRFGLDENRPVSGLSRGMRAQLALICAVAPEPDLLLLDEPTSGLDPVVRREFLETVIGAYQDGDPEHRTVLVSTHLIDEFEGLIDAFTVIEGGRNLLALDVDSARRSFKRIRLRFREEPPPLAEPWVLEYHREGRELELTARDFSPEIEAQLRALEATTLSVDNLPLEEIFVAATRGQVS